MAGRKVKREGQESLGGEGLKTLDQRERNEASRRAPGLLAWNGRLKR